MMKFYIGKNNGRRYEAQLVALSIDYLNRRVVLSTNCYEIDGEGNRIQSEVGRDYTRMLVADNLTGVDPATGDYLEPMEPDQNGEYPTEVVMLGGKAFPPGSVGEFDYFNHIRQNVPVLIEGMELSVLNKNRNRLMPDGLIPEVEEVPE